MSSFLQKIVGQKISAIEQSDDHVQICLDDATILIVFDPIRSGWPLSQFVGHAIEQVAMRPREILFFLADGSFFSVLVAEEDYRGPEAMSYIGPGGERAVWN